VVSLGFSNGVFRVHLGFHVGFLLRSSYQHFFKVSFGFHLGCLQTGENKKNKEAVKTGSREAEEQEVEQQKHMTEEKKK
jgi:hypothetical protein